MLEAVASQDLWIWHAFYGMAGANNDINVLNNSPLFDDLLDDLAPVVPYVVNGVQYRNGYYMADGIYPEWASFVKSFTVATDPKHTYFKQRQESARHRKECRTAFGGLPRNWGLIQQPARAYEVNTLRRIMGVVLGVRDMLCGHHKNGFNRVTTPDALNMGYVAQVRHNLERFQKCNYGAPDSNVSAREALAVTHNMCPKAHDKVGTQAYVS
ncbi:ALP1-like protein [Tanacetum coccineum]